MSELQCCPACGLVKFDVAGMKENRAMVSSYYERIDQHHQELRAKQEGHTLTLADIANAHDEWVTDRRHINLHLNDVRDALRNAETAYWRKRNQEVSRSAGIDRPGQQQAPAYAERAASYDMKVFTEKMNMDAVRGLVNELEDLRAHLDRLITNWDHRRVDMRWLADRIATPSG